MAAMAGIRSTAAAWAVHLLTASGIVLALLALDSVLAGRWLDSFRWLFAALVVDGVDGTLARRYRVGERLPRIDGAALDLVIDYLTYVFVPALILWRAELLPEKLALPLTALVLVTSLYVFARRDMKTEDGYFRGFPALWNVVVLYLVLLEPAPSVAAAVVASLALLTFAPIHVPHPFRARVLGRWLPAIAVLWAGATATLLVPGLAAPLSRPLLTISLLGAAAMAAIGLWRSVRGEPLAKGEPR